MDRNEETHVDWSQFDDDSNESWTNIYDHELNYAQNFISVYKRCVAIEPESVLVPIIATYAVANSKALKWCPVMFFQGASGTGKSLSSYLIAAFRDEANNIIASGATFAAIRNQLQQLRWDRDGEGFPIITREMEKPYILVWADIKEINFDSFEGKIFAMFRNGVDRTEDRILIAGKDGLNIPFYVFGQKVVSSVEDFYTKAKWSELARRLLIIKCQHLDNLSPDYVNEFKQRDHIEPYSINWQGIDEEYLKFWDNNRVQLLASLFRRKSAFKRDLMARNGFDEHRFKASFELFCVTIASEIVPDIKTAKDLWSDYWCWYDTAIVLGRESIHIVLSQVIERETELIRGKNVKLIEAGLSNLTIKPEINPMTIKQSIAVATNEGTLGITATPERVKAAMADLGWQLVENETGQIRYMEI